MAVREISNQPIKFIYDGESVNQKNARLMWDRREYCQIVKNTQTQQFQFKVTPHSGINIIANASFINGINGWQVEPGGWFWLSGGAVRSGYLGSSPLIQTIPIQSNKTYRLTYTVTFEVATPFPSAQVAVIPIVGDLDIIGGTANIDDFNNGSGTYVSYWRTSDAIADSRFYLTYTNDASGSANVYLYEVELVELSEPVLVLRDCNDNYIKDITSVQRFEDYITYTHNWENQTDGQCYKFCLYGNDNLALNYIVNSFCVRDITGGCLVDEHGRPVQGG